MGGRRDVALRRTTLGVAHKDGVVVVTARRARKMTFSCLSASSKARSEPSNFTGRAEQAGLEVEVGFDRCV